MSTNETSLWNRIKHAAYDYQESVDNFTGSLVGKDPQKVDNFDRLAGAGVASVATLTAPVWVPLSLFGCGSDSSNMPAIETDADATGDGEASVDAAEDDTIEEAKADTEENDVYTDVTGPELPELPDLKETYDTASDTKTDTAKDTAEDTAGDVSEDALPGDTADVKGDGTTETSDDVGSPEDVIAYDVASMPLTGIYFAIDPAGDDCHKVDPDNVSMCLYLASDELELDASALFNSANSEKTITIVKADNKPEPKDFDFVDDPPLKLYTKLEYLPEEGDFITSDMAIWSIRKYMEIAGYSEDKQPQPETVGKLEAMMIEEYDEVKGFYASYVIYISSEAKLKGATYKCEWQWPFLEGTPTTLENCGLQPIE